MKKGMQLPLLPDADGRMGKLETAFWKFHQENPVVYKTLCVNARVWRLNKGKDAQLGIKMLFERVRWELSITKELKEVPKLNNNHTAFYARLIMDRNPDLKDIFLLRQQRVPATIGPENSSLPSGEHIS
jgi:hypothetical protein